MKNNVFYILLVGTIIMIVVMAKTGASLKTIQTPKGIIDLEFAYNIKKTTVVTNAWSSNALIDNINAAKKNTYLDFIFLFFYSTFLFYSCKKVSLLNNYKPGFLFAKAAIFAGIFDVLENIGMLITLSGQKSAPIAMLTTTFSIIKWGLVAIAILYLIISLAVIIANGKFRLLIA